MFFFLFSVWTVIPNDTTDHPPAHGHAPIHHTSRKIASALHSNGTKPSSTKTKKSGGSGGSGCVMKATKGRTNTKRTTSTSATTTTTAAASRPHSHSHSLHTNGKKNTSKSGGIVTKKLVKSKKKVSRQETVKRGVANHENHHHSYTHHTHNDTSGTSVASHSDSASGVLSFDNILTSGILATTSSYGRVPHHTPHSHHTASHHAIHHSEGKPPRPPSRRPVSANAATSTSRGRHTQSQSQSQSPSRRHADLSNRTSSSPSHRIRGRGSAIGGHTLRSHSLTSEPMSLSQFNITHSPYRMSQNQGQAHSSKQGVGTYMSSRRGGQK